MDSSEEEVYDKPFVIISGGGIAGLTLANLLEVAEIPYLILEKATKYQPLGSAISLSGEVFTFMEQLGLYSDLVKVAKFFKSILVRSLDQETDEIKYIGKFESHLDNEALFGYDAVVFARPDLLNVLMKRIPKEKILMKKKVLSIVYQNPEEKVKVKTSDGYSYECDLLVGADGCYSPVRQSMYKAMEARGEKLPLSDTLPMTYNNDCLVGITEPLDPKIFPVVLEEKASFEVTLVKQQRVALWFIPLVNGRIGWMVNEGIPKEKRPLFGGSSSSSSSFEESNFKNSEWGPHAAVEMSKRLGQLATPFGVRFEEIYKRTDENLISKVMLEEKFYSTWNDGRVCLIGDACHKTLPFGGQGARQAMMGKNKQENWFILLKGARGSSINKDHVLAVTCEILCCAHPTFYYFVPDALELANVLYDLPSTSHSDITNTLNQYHVNRKARGKNAVRASSESTKLLHSKGMMRDLIRKVVLNHMPEWIFEKTVTKMMEYRPQCVFLPFRPRESTGTNPVIPQVYSPRYLRKLARGKRIEKEKESEMLKAYFS